MAKYFNVKLKVSQEVVSKKGGVSTKDVSELYVVHAETPGDAEVKIHTHMKNSLLDFSVTSITETKVLEVVV